MPEKLVTKVNMLNTVDSDTRSEVLPIEQNEATQNDSSPSRNRNGPQSHRLTSETVSTNVRSTIRRRPNVIAVETRKAAEIPAIRPVDIVPTSQVMVHENRCIGTVSGEMLPEEPKVVPAEMAKKANTEGPTKEQYLHDNQNYMKTTIMKLTMNFVQMPRPTTKRLSVEKAEEARTDGTTSVQCLFDVQNCKMTTIAKLPTDFVETPRLTIQRVSVKVDEEASTDGATNEQCLYDNQNHMKTTSTKLPTDYVKILKPALPRVSVIVAEDASTDGATNKQFVYEVLDNKKTTTMKVFMDFLEIPQPSFTRGFLKLAEEARNVCIENEDCFLVNVVLPQVTGMTRRVIEPVSWSLEEKLGQLFKVTRNGTLRVPPEKFEAGQMMQWADIKSDGVMIDGIMLRSEMSPVGPARGVAEPVLWTAKSEVFTSVVFAGG